MIPMTTVTQAEIEQYRSQLQEYPDALKALDVLEECEGDLEFAAETVAIETGELADDLSEKDPEEDPNKPSWLEKLVEKLRPHICTQAFREVLTQGFCGCNWFTNTCCWLSYINNIGGCLYK